MQWAGLQSPCIVHNGFESSPLTGDPHGWLVHGFGRVNLLFVEIELSLKPSEVLTYRGTPRFSPWHLVPTGGALRRCREIPRIVNDP
jgi:hypothetical protein